MGGWISNNLDWMYWTTPSALVFIALFGAIAALGVWDRLSPGYARKGMLPIATTRGDRFFIGVITTIAVFLVWLAFAGNTAIWAPAVIAAGAFAALFRFG